MTCCGHQFHHSCFKTAFETCSTTCPMCRQDVPEVHICDNNVFRTIPNTYSKPPTDFDTLVFNFGQGNSHTFITLNATSPVWVDILEPYARFVDDEYDEDYMEVEDIVDDVEDMDIEEEGNNNIEIDNMDWVDDLLQEETENENMEVVESDMWDEVLDILLAETEYEEDTPITQNEVLNVGVY